MQRAWNEDPGVGVAVGGWATRAIQRDDHIHTHKAKLGEEAKYDVAVVATGS